MGWQATAMSADAPFPRREVMRDPVLGAHPEREDSQSSSGSTGRQALKRSVECMARHRAQDQTTLANPANDAVRFQISDRHRFPCRRLERNGEERRVMTYATDKKLAYATPMPKVDR